jgi:hypothetical protein
MTALTEIAYKTRLAIVVGVVFIFAVIIIQIVVKFFLGVLFVLFPPQPPKPNNQFGVLPALKFPPAASPSGQLTLTLETITGTLPQATATAVVYQMPKTAANLLGVTKTQEFAQKIKLDPNAIQESKNIYRFVDPEYPLRKLRYDIISNNFILRYAYEQDAGVFAERFLPRDNETVNESKNFLTVNNLYHNDVKNGTSIISYLKLSGNKLVPTTSLSQADAVRIDYFRQPVNGLKILTPSPAEGQVAFVFSGSKTPQKRILLVAYTLWTIDLSVKGTYQVKPVTDAWEELVAGSGFIARYPQNTLAVTVRNAYLAYYDSFDSQPFLQPIYVFEGDDGFTAYVPAVANQWSAQ